jgi:hypothetical protein
VLASHGVPLACNLTSIQLEVCGLSQQTDWLHQHILNQYTDITATEALCMVAQLLKIILCRQGTATES